MEHMPHQEPPTPSEEDGLQYENLLQIKLAERAFPDAHKPLYDWVGDGSDSSLSARFRAWLDDPTHPHIHLDDGDAQDQLLAALRGSTLH